MRVFVSLGERSASNYIYHIFKEVRGVEFYGITEESLEAIGFRSVARLEDLSVVGLVEALPKVPYVYRLLSRIESLLPQMDVLILCDAPAFNLPLLKRARSRVKKIIYFISPQVWAWKEGRARLIAELADHLVVLLPFEVDFYRKYAREGFSVHFVGHPLVDMAKATLKEEQVRNFVGYRHYMALLPGSRWSEVKRHVPYLLRVLTCLKPELPVVVPTFQSFSEYIEERLKNFAVKVVTPQDMEKPSHNLMAYADLTLLASGTAELEASLLEAPHLVFYRVNPLTYLMGKLLVKVRYVALTNLILGREVVPEFVQKSPEKLCRYVKALQKSPETLEKMKQEFEKLREVLGGEGAIERLRELFLQLLHNP